MGPVLGSWIVRGKNRIFSVLSVFGIDPVAGEQDKGTIAQDVQVHDTHHGVHQDDCHAR
jgi:hypothetical protein